MYKLQRFQLKNILSCIYAGATTRCDGWGVRMTGERIFIESCAIVPPNEGIMILWKMYSIREGIKELWSILKETQGLKKSAILKKGILRNA